jgi:hypothetical protein
MESTTPIIDKSYLIQKFPGKGGWSFVSIPEITQDKRAWFGMVKVRGRIDGYEIENYHIMPMGNGTMFLPINGKIRKATGKKEGDWIHVLLYSQELPAVEPDDLMVCLNDEPEALNRYNKLPETEKRKINDWIYSVKNDEIRVERIAQTIERLLNMRD